MAENNSLPEGDMESTRSEPGPPAPPERPAFKDRKVALVAFGVVQLLIGLGVFLMAGLQFAVAASLGGLVPPGSAPQSKWTFLWAAVFYFLVAVGIAVLGVGSIYCRRWARALTLVLSALALATGVCVSIMMFFWTPAVMRSMESQMGGPQPGFGFVMGCMAVGMAVMYLILPAAFVVFYRSPHVKATCESRDSKERWTDRLPLPVLAGALLFLPGSFAMFAPATGMGVPFFGWFARGAAAWLVAGVLGAGSAAVAWGLFRMQRWGWLAAIAATVFYGANVLMSFRGEGMIDWSRNMQVSPEQLELMQDLGFPSAMMPIVAVSFVLLLGFYLWLGRYFKPVEPV